MTVGLFILTSFSVTLVWSHPILIVLLSCVSTSATRLILRLLTPCKKETVTITHTSSAGTHNCARRRTAAASEAKLIVRNSLKDMIAHDRETQEPGQELLTKVTERKLFMRKA